MILVVGTGKSGTSLVARILHERLGISMGNRFGETSVPDGAYEDMDFRDLNMMALRGQLTLSAFKESIEALMRMRREPWGFKDPYTAELIGLYLQWLERPLVIWCRRDTRSAARSTERTNGLPFEEALRIMRHRNLQLRRALMGRPGLVELHFDNHWNEHALERVLRRIIKGGGGVKSFSLCCRTARESRARDREIR